MFEVLLKVLEEDSFLTYLNKITIAAIENFFMQTWAVYLLVQFKSQYTETKDLLLYFALLFESNDLNGAVT